MATPTTAPFEIIDATIDGIQSAFKSGQLTCRQLVQAYLDRIEALDKNGPGINSIISVSPTALAEAERLDRAYAASGLTGPLHGIPVILKDQIDAVGMATTLGSVLFKNFFPDRDAFIVEKMKQAGAVILGKATLGELGGGDTHGSLFGSTKNPYALERTVGGSSGGTAASVSANFATLGVGQEGLASIRRPSTWNSIVGMRSTAGLVSRTGSYSGWPQKTGTLGPMARTVKDLTLLLDVIAGYDSDDPLTARGFGHYPQGFSAFLDRNGLAGARIGILREPMGYHAEPDSDDFKQVSEVFDKAVADLKAAGATIVDPIVIPRLNELLAKRADDPTSGEEAFAIYYGRNSRAPFKTRAEAMAAPEFAHVSQGAKHRLKTASDAVKYYEFLRACDTLMTNLLKVMADNRLDAIVHKSVEHQPTLIRDGINPPYVNHRGAPHLNTFLIYVPTIALPAGFTRDGLPAGISFLGRPYADGQMIKLAYAYEQATRHRRPPLIGQ
ncbi:MAG: amidase [Deltaproteobacteria bacterium]|nr:amidase [Deltaproteobacteria bacterium]